MRAVVRVGAVVSMAATDVTIEHYERPEVKEVILRYCQGEHGSRALNADEHWYKGGKEPKTVMLRGPEDYDATIKRGRTLYATLDILEQAVFERCSGWNRERNEPEITLGTLENCMAFTLGTDIDSIGDIRKSLVGKQAVEAAAQFHVDYLREAGIENSVYCLYSGGGVYVQLHHGLFSVDVGNTELTPEARRREFSLITKAYNMLIGEISQAFFRKYPQYIGLVKFDQLNNQKRTFKTIFSIHKRHPFAVIPLDPKAIKISFEKASLPLSDEVLQEGAQWYQSFDPSEKKALGTLLKDKIEAVRAAERDRPEGGADREISRQVEPLDLANFAPCMKNIIEKAEDREGRHRALAILSTYLYQMGWEEDPAFDLWRKVADRGGVESRIFETTFGRVSCPLCTTLQTGTGGYPSLNFSGMSGFCERDDHCQGCQWPGDHHLQKILNENFDKPKADEQKPKGPTVSEAIERIKSDHRALKDPAILAALANLKSNDPIEFDLTVDEIKKAHKGLRVDTIREMVDKFILESKEAHKAAKETPEAIKEKALAIAERGDPLKYLVWQAQRNHLGDIDYQKVLIASIASAASKKSNGIQPGGNGDKGSGKSDACESVYHLTPPDRRLDGSLSPMSLFYLQQSGRIQAGMVLHSDDVEYEPIIPIYKRSTAGFQKSTTHFSVTSGKNREAIELTIPPRIVWWLTSVESVANEQAFDRQYPISTDSSPAHKKRVADEIAARRARKELKLEEDEGIAVARAILVDMFDNGPFKVVIPQAKEAKWLRTADFRGQEQFWDMVDALAILRWRQRKKDPDGWLIADYQDLIEAKEIHSGHKAAHFADLTEAEVKIIGVMSDGIPKTQGQLTAALDVAQSTVSERLRSIMAKSPLITEEYEHGRKTYTINSKAEKLGGDYWNGLDLIELGISSKEAYRSQKIALSVCYRYVIGLPIGIVINNSKRIPTTLTVNKEESTKRGCTCDDCGICPLGKCLSSIHSTDKPTDNVQNQQQEPLSDTDKSDRYDPIRTDKAYKRPSDIPIRHASATIDPEDPPEDPPEEQREPKCKDAPIPKTPRFPGMKKRVCCLCGHKSTFDLTPYSNPAKGIRGYICVNCHMHGPPATPEEANPQTTLEGEA